MYNTMKTSSQRQGFQVRSSSGSLGIVSEVHGVINKENLLIVLCACIHVNHRGQKIRVSPATEVTGNFVLLCGCWEWYHVNCSSSVIAFERLFLHL